MPFISVIVPNFNHADFLDQRIQSVLNQTYQNFELILLDDSSTDNSKEILSNFKNHPKVSHFEINEMNSGSPFNQWGKGIELAKGEFIWIAESDDYCSNNFLETAVNEHRNNPDCGMIYVKTNYIDPHNNVLPPDDYQINLNNLFQASGRFSGKDYIEEYLIKKNTILNASSLIFNKALFLKSGGFDSKLKYCGDYYLYFKMLHYTNIYYINEALNFRRQHNNSHTSSLQGEWLDELIEIRIAFRSFFKANKISSKGSVNQNEILLKELYGSKSISLAKKRKIFKAFQTLLKVSPKHFFEYLKHDLYWIKKGEYDK